MLTLCVYFSDFVYNLANVNRKIIRVTIQPRITVISQVLAIISPTDFDVVQPPQERSLLRLIYVSRDIAAMP